MTIVHINVMKCTPNAIYADFAQLEVIEVILL